MYKILKSLTRDSVIFKTGCLGTLDFRAMKQLQLHYLGLKDNVYFPKFTPMAMPLPTPPLTPLPKLPLKLKISPITPTNASSRLLCKFKDSGNTLYLSFDIG